MGRVENQTRSLCLFRFFELFEKYDGYKTGKLKLKKPEQLQVRGDLPGHCTEDLGDLDPSERFVGIVNGVSILHITYSRLMSLASSRDCSWART